MLARPCVSPIRATPRSAGASWFPRILRDKVDRIDRRRARRRRGLRSPSHRLGVPRGGSTSSMATPSRTKPTWTGCTASISTRAATSARRWCRAWSIAAPRARGWCRSILDGFSPRTRHRRCGRRQARRHDGLVGRQGRGLAMLRLDRVADALAARQAADAQAALRIRCRPSRTTSSSSPKQEAVGMSRSRAPACRRPEALPLAGRRPALRRLSRRRMGRAGIRRPRAVRKADARRLPGRAVVDHDPAQARQFPQSLRRFRARRRSRATTPRKSPR